MPLHNHIHIHIHVTVPVHVPVLVPHHMPVPRALVLLLSISVAATSCDRQLTHVLPACHCRLCPTVQLLCFASFACLRSWISCLVFIRVVAILHLVVVVALRARETCKIHVARLCEAVRTLESHTPPLRPLHPR